MSLLNFLSKRVPDPDIHYAAKGYAMVAISRRHAPHIDLHKLERGYADELLLEGCTSNQALSARWGGAYAIADDLSTFDDALSAYKETLAEIRDKHAFGTKKEAERAYVIAATMVLGVAHASDPKEYGRFLAFVGA